jgi:hypothetical protein
MATTILPKKAGQERPMATDDEQYAQLAEDPTIHQFPQGTTYESSPFNGSATFSPPSSGRFNPTDNFDSPAFNQQSTSNFGNTTNTNQSNGTIPVLTGAAPTNAASGADILVGHDKDSNDWINKKWRPAMGWSYMLTCITDFVIFPILWSVLQAVSKGQVTSQWQPLTLQGAGLYHIAMGAVLGIAAYGRTKEKIESATKN